MLNTRARYYLGLTCFFCLFQVQADERYEWKNYSTLFPEKRSIADSRWTGTHKSKMLFGYILHSCVDKKDLFLYVSNLDGIIKIKTWKVSLPFRWRQPIEINPKSLGSKGFVYYIAKLTPSMFPAGVCEVEDLKQHEKNKKERGNIEARPPG